ncbi:hypothetical protein MZE22_11305, partial [Escherichia coli]|nr:hypothetical protein [Escherichia coli]MCK2524507.1 hypothetical protein [Escherichia coli]
MSGKPAARQGDMTQYGGSIVQGSAGVRIGAPTGVACSGCPGGVTSGHPVNPLLGAKVLPAYSALFDHGLASKSDQRFASIRSTG